MTPQRLYSITARVVQALFFSGEVAKDATPSTDHTTFIVF